ncbi:MAG: chemotaxis protein CheB [Pseudomonadota bacterium]
MKSQALRIGLIGSGDDSSSKLLRLLTEQGMQIVHALLPKELTDAHIAASDLDVWLLDLDDSHWHSQLDELMDRSPVPIFFNEHQSIEGQQHLDYWCRNLISRMFELVADVPGLPPASSTAAGASARAGETLPLAFAPKAESKPSDDLNAVPTALDPDLLQEMEELEQLLQRQSDSHADALSELDAELPLPAATTVAASKPAPASTESTSASSGSKSSQAPARQAADISANVGKPEPQSHTSAVEAAPAASAGAGRETLPDDPVAAAKARAAKIQQAAAAARANAAAPGGEAAAAQKAATPPAVASQVVASQVVTSQAVTPKTELPKTEPVSAGPASAGASKPMREAAPAASAQTAAAAPVSASSASTAKAIAPASSPVSAGTVTKPATQAASTQTIATQTIAATTVTTAPAKTSAGTTAPATPVAKAPTAPAQPGANAVTGPVGAPSASKASAEVAASSGKPDAVTLLASTTPVVPPPERHDWPQFPPPVEPVPATPEADAAFAPMQPQPAAGPMREPAKPAPVQLVRAVPASKPARPGASVATPELPFTEPVPTLTRVSDDALEFETVEFEPAGGHGAVTEADHSELDHPELDVPMLESVVVASEFEAVEAPAPVLPCDLWVLGASLGGPAALKRFFAALNQPLPICFLLAQHIDAHFLPVLGKILEQANPFYPVQVLARPGLIEPGTLLLAPIEKRLRFLDAGQIVNGARSWTPPYSPCIDDVLSDVAAAYPGQVHAIVFSGMGEDGVNGARAIADCRGEVWVQDADSCASSVMPDAIDKAGLARFRATPEELAARLMARYNPAVSGQHLA